MVNLPKALMWQAVFERVHCLGCLRLDNTQFELKEHSHSHKKHLCVCVCVCTEHSYHDDNLWSWSFVEVTPCAQVVKMHLKKELVARTVFPLTAMTSSVSERFIKTQLKGVRNCKHFILGILLTNATWKP